MKKYLLISVLGATVFLSPVPGYSAEQEQAQQNIRIQKQEQVYGSQLMTRQERAEYRVRMRTAKTAEEREQIRKEHHERMKERSRERGVTLPDEPPIKGGGMGPVGGAGYGGGRRR